MDFVIPNLECPLGNEEDNVPIKNPKELKQYLKGWSIRHMWITQLPDNINDLANYESAGRMYYVIRGNIFFKLPNGFVTGGVTGISVLLARITSMTVGAWIWILNIVLLLLVFWF